MAVEAETLHLGKNPVTAVKLTQGTEKMVGFYERKWSSAALWCERLALLCIPYFGLAIVLHRFDRISSPQVVWLLAIGFALVAGALAFGIRALVDLWTRGLRGGKATIRGVVVATLFLVPFIWHGFLAVEHPMIADVSTNPFTPPVFKSGELASRNTNGGETPFADYNETYADLLIAEYPKVGSRRFNAGAERVLASIRELVAKRNWRIVETRGLPQDQEPAELQADEQPGAENAKPKAAAKAKATKEPEAEPVTADETEAVNIEMEAVASTLVIGFKHDIIIQITSEAEATLVDMRSVSRNGLHDFGGNAALIESFLGDLDTSLLGIAGEG